ADAGPRGRHDIGAGDDEELAALRQVADIDAIRAGRVLDLEVPTVAPAVDVDVADGGFRGRGRLVGTDVEQPQDRLGAVPVLPEGGLGPLDGLVRQFPIRV